MRDEHDDDDIARDGEVLRVPLYSIDSTPPVHDGVGGIRMNQPGYRYGSAQAEQRRVDAREDYVRRTTEAWQSGEQERPAGGGGGRDAYCDWLRNAWRGAR